MPFDPAVLRVMAITDGLSGGLDDLVDRAAAAVAGGHGATCVQVRLKGEPDRVVSTVSRALVERLKGEGGAPAPGLTNQLAARAEHDTADRLGSITCPTLVCGGRFDGIAPPANSEFLARGIPGARLEMFDGGHGFFIQDAAALPAIIAFLAEGAPEGDAP